MHARILLVALCGMGSIACGPDPTGEDDTDGGEDCAELQGDNTLEPTPLGPLDYPELHCSPRQSGVSDYRCCSDDPAAVGGGLPDFAAAPAGGSATPYFSGPNNLIGSSGVCVRTADIPSGSGMLEPEAAGCPVPCNPTWSDDDVVAICGSSRQCCQTRELQPEDCVQDEDGTWRPASGADIVPGQSDWAKERHATHQDPSGQSCAVLAGGSGTEFNACLEQLTVANQRGFCMALSPGQVCPHDAPDYIHVCEQINMDLLPPPG